MKLKLSDKAIRRIAQQIVEEVDRPYEIGEETPLGVIRDIIQRNGEDVYIVGGSESGMGAQLLSLQDLEEDINRALKNQEYQEGIEIKRHEEDAYNQERNDLKGYTDNMNPRQKGLVEKFLLNSRPIFFRNQDYRQKEFVEELLAQGFQPSEDLIEGKYSAINEEGVFVAMQKTAYDYMVYLYNI